jgi:hypothetical protein
MYASMSLGTTDDYLGELMKYIKVDSYSNCHKTPGLVSPPGYEAKWRVSAEYKFHLAFENIPLDDYVTEKFFQPWKYGTRTSNQSSSVILVI